VIAGGGGGGRTTGGGGGAGGYRTSAGTSGGGGSGTVTSVSVVSANGFAGTVANATTTPAVTLSTSITGVLKGNGTAISAASAGTDYQAPITLTTTGTSGAATFVANTLNIPQYSGGGGSGTVTSVDATVPTFLSVSGGPITTSGTLAISYSGTALPIANGGTGTATPNLIAGENVTLSGSWPSQTVNSTYTGFKNRFINGQMQIAQRATSGTSGAAVPTTAPVYPCVDRWYAYATGATVTVARVAGSGAIQYNLQATGAGSVTAIGIGQRIEQENCYDMAGSTATLSVNISNSLLTTVTWTASYATSADTWSSKTQIATGTFTVTSTLTNYNAQISIPAAATTGIEILFTVGAQTSGTWEIGNVQLEKGSVATSYDYRAYGTELNLCYRYYYKIFPEEAGGVICTSGYAVTTTQANYFGIFPVPMRIGPTALEQSGTAGNYAVTTPTAGTLNCSSVPTIQGPTNSACWMVQFIVASGMTANQFAHGRTSTGSGASAYLAWSAEL
jgi:hypothetical protein